MDREEIHIPLAFWHIKDESLQLSDWEIEQLLPFMQVPSLFGDLDIHSLAAMSEASDVLLQVAEESTSATVPAGRRVVRVREDVAEQTRKYYADAGEDVEIVEVPHYTQFGRWFKPSECFPAKDDGLRAVDPGPMRVTLAEQKAKEEAAKPCAIKVQPLHKWSTSDLYGALARLPGGDLVLELDRRHKQMVMDARNGLLELLVEHRSRLDNQDEAFRGLARGMDEIEDRTSVDRIVNILSMIAARKPEKAE